jgi:hypothetical protein
MPRAVIIGVGPDRGLGARLCKRFAGEGNCGDSAFNELRGRWQAPA